MRNWLKQWEVESVTEPGKFYTVSMDLNRKLQCACPAWKFQKVKIKGTERAPCKHCTFIMGQLEAAKRGTQAAQEAIKMGLSVFDDRAVKLERGLEKALERMNNYARQLNSRGSVIVHDAWTVASWLDRLDEVSEPVVPEAKAKAVPVAPEEFKIKRVISFD